MTKLKKFLFFLAALAVISGLALAARAEDNPLGDFPGNDFSFQQLVGITTGLACWLSRVASVAALIFVLLAGMRFAAARANSDAFSKAKANFKTVLWGILVIYAVYVIIATVAGAVGITDFSFIPLVC